MLFQEVFNELLINTIMDFIRVAINFILKEFRLMLKVLCSGGREGSREAGKECCQRWPAPLIGPFIVPLKSRASLGINIDKRGLGF